MTLETVPEHGIPAASLILEDLNFAATPTRFGGCCEYNM
jgi:hypothetical protein